MIAGNRLPSDALTLAIKKKLRISSAYAKNSCSNELSKMGDQLIIYVK